MSERATLTLTVSPGSIGEEELRISIPMEVIKVSSLSPEEETSQEQSSMASLVSGILLSTSLRMEEKLRSLPAPRVIEMASTYMDQPGVDCGLGPAIVHVMKNVCVSMLLEVMQDEQEQFPSS